MKKLILTLLLVTSSVMAQEPVITKIVNDSGVVVTIHDYSQTYSAK